MINSILNQTFKNIEIVIIYDDDKLSDLQFIKKKNSKNKIKNKINCK